MHSGRVNFVQGFGALIILVLAEEALRWLVDRLGLKMADPQIDKWLRDNTMFIVASLIGALVVLALVIVASDNIKERLNQSKEAPVDVALAPEKDRARFIMVLRARYDHYLQSALGERKLIPSPLPEVSTDEQVDATFLKPEAHPVIALSSSAGRAKPPLGARDTSSACLDNAVNSRTLIVGEPGVGKTTLLTRMASELLTRAPHDTAVPLPVVFNLASWSKKRLPLGDWLVEELVTVYHVRRPLARAWVMTEEILPLLDSFDEVDQANRAACAMEINRYQHEHAVVVSSRRAEYFAQPARLRMQAVVRIDPCEDDREVEKYLATVSAARGETREAPTADAARNSLRDCKLDLTPVTLDVVLLARQSGAQETVDACDSDLVLQTYVDSMLARVRSGAQSDKPAGESDERADTKKDTAKHTHWHWPLWLAQAFAKNYKPEVTKVYLGWLAQALCDHKYTNRVGEPDVVDPLDPNSNYFYPGRLEPDWLPKDDFLRSHDLLLGLGCLFLLGLAAALAALFLGATAVSGVVYGLILGIAVSWSIKVDLRPPKRLHWSWWRAGVGLFCGFIIGPVYGLMIWLVFGVIAGLIAVLAGLAGRPGPWPVAFLTLLRQGLLALLFVLLAALLIVVLVAPASLPAILAALAPELSNPASLAVALLFRLFAACALAIFGGFLPDQSDARELNAAPAAETGDFRPLARVGSRPNYRIRQSGLDGLVAGLGAATLAGLGASILFAHGPATALYVPFLMGLAFGLVATMFGGMAAVQHALIRVQLAHRKLAPLNYARFLEYVVDHALLKPVEEGGYIFVNETLRDYLANEYTTDTQRRAEEAKQRAEEAKQQAKRRRHPSLGNRRVSAGSGKVGRQGRREWGV